MNKLAAIAEKMTHQCLAILMQNPEADYCIVQRQLSHGLSMSLEVDQQFWRLTLARLNIAPSSAEIVTCQRAFLVDDVTTTFGSVYTPSGACIKTARLEWKRQIQLGFFRGETETADVFEAA